MSAPKDYLAPDGAPAPASAPAGPTAAKPADPAAAKPTAAHTSCSAPRANTLRPGADTEIPPELSGPLSALPAGEELLVAIDIDGTLVGHDGSYSRRVAQAVQAHQEIGTRLVLATGRGAAATEPILELLGIDNGWAVICNGAVTLEMDHTVPAGYHTTRIHELDPAEPLALLRQVLPNALYSAESAHGPRKVSAPFPPGELPGPATVVPFAELAASPVTRITVRAPELTPSELVAAVRSVGLHGVEYAVGWTAWLDVGPEGISKASALDQVREDLGVSPTRTVAIGDGMNDLEMLEWAHLGISMGQASEAVHARANLRTATVEEDGLALVLEALLP